MDIMNLLGDIISVAAIVTFLLSLLAKVLPNEKVWEMGIKVGQFLNSFGHSKVGDSWEKIEDFFINSFGQFFGGLKVGLDLEQSEPLPPAPKDDEEIKENTDVRK